MKDPIALLSAAWLHETFDMEVVLMVRHPAAFAGSLKANGWAFPFEDLHSQPELMKTHLGLYRDEIEAMCGQDRPIVEQAALLWKCLYHVVRKYQERYPCWQVIRYEDLAATPRDQYRRLYENLGLEWTEQIATRIEEQTEKKRRWNNRLKASEVNYLRQTTADVWKNFYSAEDWE